MTALQTDHHGYAGTPGTETGVLALAGAGLILSGAWAIADEFDSRLQRDLADTAYFRAFSLTQLLAFSLMAVAVGVVVRRRWSGDGRAARLATVLLWAGALQAVCAQWYVAFVTPTLADVAPTRVNAEEGFLAVGLGVALVTFAAALLALGIAALRAGRVSRRTSWLTIASGAAFILLPGAQLLLGLALLSGRSESTD